METLELLLPEAWAGYLVNGDASGLTAAEIRAADATLETQGLARGSCVNVEDAQIITRYHDGTLFWPGQTVCAVFAFAW